MKATTRDIEHDQIRAALHAVVETNNGILNPRAVLEVARDPAHVLHRHFEWDDAAASENYRLAQVGALIRRVRFTVIRAHSTTRQVTVSTTRGYQSRPSMRSKAGGYEAVDTILADVEKRAELLAQVLAELTAYRRRYAELSELEAVWIALDDVRETHADVSSPLPLGGDDARPGVAG